MSKPTFKGILNGVVGVARELQPFPNTRLANGISNRDQQIMTWRLPNGSSVQMYINPQNFTVKDSKQINSVKTKGGYVVQYWGQNLTELNLSGTTGSSGIRGIEVLYDIYSAENRAFELVAATQTNDLVQSLSDTNLGDSGFGEVITKYAQTLRERNFILRPSLASLATSILLFYQGVQYKGFFTDFTVTESVQNLGLFDYNMTYYATERRGRRNNVFAWNKEPLANDAAGQLINSVGNTIRNAFGFNSQNPVQFKPESAPYTFGGNSIQAASQGANGALGAIATIGSLL